MSEYTIYRTLTEWYQNDKPLLYLGGSIVNNWQDPAIDLLVSKHINAHIADPHRYAENSDPSKAEYDISWDWKIYHIRTAAATGAVLFWLDKECIDVDLRHDVAEMITHMKYRNIHQPDRPLKLLIGVEPGYCGEKYMRYRMADDLPDFVVFNKLDDLCNEAIKTFESVV
jgi:hypothetical protein